MRLQIELRQEGVYVIPPTTTATLSVKREPHLVIAAFWTTEDYDASTAKVGEALEEIAIKGSGAAVSIKAVDPALRQWLRNVQIEEAADWHA